MQGCKRHLEKALSVFGLVYNFLLKKQMAGGIFPASVCSLPSSALQPPTLSPTPTMPLLFPLTERGRKSQTSRNCQFPSLSSGVSVSFAQEKNLNIPFKFQFAQKRHSFKQSPVKSCLPQKTQTSRYFSAMCNALCLGVLPCLSPHWCPVQAGSREPLSGVWAKVGPDMLDPFCLPFLVIFTPLFSVSIFMLTLQGRSKMLLPVGLLC